MNDDTRKTQEQQTVSFVEEQLTVFVAELRCVCAGASRLGAEHIRVAIAAIDAAMSRQATYEHAAGSEWLSPLYFSLADEINERRAQLVKALGAVDDTVASALDFLAAGDELLRQTPAYLEQSRRGESSLRLVRVFQRKTAPQAMRRARWFARVPELSVLREQLLKLATNLDALRTEAGKLL